MSRRVLTGLDGDGRSCVISDGLPEDLWLMRAGADGNLLDGSRTSVADRHDPADGEAFNVDSWTVTPAMVGTGRRDVGESGELCRWIHTVFGARTHAHLHATPTYDVDLIVAGEVELLLETGGVLLRAGDTVIIPGVVHGWRTGHQQCSFMCTMYPLGAAVPAG
jgi:quercetin dioxygenase-like cupin family protein